MNICVGDLEMVVLLLEEVVDLEVVMFVFFDMMVLV